MLQPMMMKQQQSQKELSAKSSVPSYICPNCDHTAWLLESSRASISLKNLHDFIFEFELKQPLWISWLYL
jgi:hypothetical protein